MKINDNIYMLELPVGAGNVEELIYPAALVSEDGITLVDTGFPGQLERIYEAFENEGLDIKKLNKIILTHHDIDHIGNAKLLKNEIGGDVKIVAFEEEADYIDGSKTPLKLKKFKENLTSMPEGAEKIYAGMKRGFEMCKVKIDKTLKDGEILNLCGGVTVIHTPGHTLGHISLYLNKYETLITGDTLTIDNGQLAPLDESYHFDNELNTKSIEILRKLSAKKIICYHGGFIEL